MRITRTIKRTVIRFGYVYAQVRFPEYVSEEARYQSWLYWHQPENLRGIPGDEARLARWLETHTDGPRTGAQC